MEGRFCQKLSPRLILAYFLGRALRTGDELIRAFLLSAPAPGFATWHDRSSPHLERDSAITEAFYKTAASTPAELSFGNRDDRRTFAIINEPIMDPASEQSKIMGYWAGSIGSILDEGWRECYTDGTGRDSGTASPVHSEDRKGGYRATYEGYLGEIATVADGDLDAMR